MKHLSVIILLLYSITTYCQERRGDVPLNKNGDTAYSYFYTKDLCNNLGIPMLSQSPYQSHFRLWASNNRVIEIWQNDKYEYKGQVIFWVPECRKSTNESLDQDIYCGHDKLNAFTVQELLGIIDSTKVNTIPSDNLIVAWNEIMVDDGIVYIIEYANKHNYTLKTYGNPQTRTSIKEANIVQNVVESFNKVTHIDSLWKDFTTNIPYMCYTISGYISVTKPRIVSHREFKRLLRKQKRREKKYNKTYQTNK